MAKPFLAINKQGYKKMKEKEQKKNLINLIKKK